jgi:hypothetical protein
VNALSSACFHSASLSLFRINLDVNFQQPELPLPTNCHLCLLSFLLCALSRCQII